MRLWLNCASLDDRTMVKGLLAAEQILAESGLTLPECLQLLIDPASAPHEHQLKFDEAESAALIAAYGSRPPKSAGLGLVLSPGDVMPAVRKRRGKR